MLKKIIFRAAAVILTMLTVISLFSCSKDDKTLKGDTVVLTVNEIDVPYSVLRYFILNYKSEYGALESDFWDGSEEKNEISQKILNQSIQSVREMYAIFSLSAEYGIDPFADVMQKRLEAEYEKEKNSYESKKAFAEYLGKSYLDEESCKLLMLSKLCADELYYALLNSGEVNTDPEFIKDVISSDEFIRVQHILIVPNSASAEDMSAAEATANEAYQKAIAGTDFFELVREYGEDTYMYGNSDGYYIMRGVWNKEFENVSFALDVGEISNVFYTYSGYSIIKRLEKDPEYLEKNFEKLRDDYYDAKYNIAIEECVESAVISETDAFAGISIADVN